jgi:hypothetical protein
LADAILDRLTASAHRIALTGKSLRKKKISKFENHFACLVMFFAGLTGDLCAGINGVLLCGMMGYFRRNI